MFDSAAGSVKFPELEARIGAFWRERRIYEKSLARRAGAPRFVFYEGPPTANGLPHPGHCLTRAIKDVFPRYRTMRGYLCERKAGWDTHGLPVEVEVCKELGIHSKEEIEAYGVEPFIHKCLESVFRYTQQWERLTERLGFWVNLSDAYVTYHQPYIESVWWSLKTLFDRGLLYQGHKIVWWWAQGGTALSAGEVGQGYREVADPSVYVRFDIEPSPQSIKLGLSEAASLLVWTTTPWTLPSNQFAAVHPELEYALVEDPERAPKLIMAAALVEAISAKIGRPLTILRTFRGEELVGLTYRPPFDYYYIPPDHNQRFINVPGQNAYRDGVDEKQQLAWRVIAGDFVTVTDGTGIVHIAPAFGEIDYQVLVDERRRFVEGSGLELILPVGPDGKFTADAPDYQGRWVKEADKDIARELRRRGLLFHQEQYLHEYPFCWRADEDPLIQYPRESWFIRTSQFKDRMLANNAQINWLPEHIKDGRFGNFLESNVDWALSRERYWGTPLPIWKCDATGRMEAIASYDDLLAKPGIAGTEVWAAAKQARPDLAEHLKVHKPYIDAVTYDSPFAAGARMNRVPEVIDCWYDSGAMPFAQWGYPHTGQAEFKEQFPADFISEAIDQTRGWFYSQLAISTLLFGSQAPAKDLNLGFVDLSEMVVPPSVLESVPESIARENVVFPIEATDGSLKLAISEMDHPEILDKLRFIFKSNVEFALASRDAIICAIDRHYLPLRSRVDDANNAALCEFPVVAIGAGEDVFATMFAREWPHPFRNCIVLGLMLGEDGQKMSKSKRNYREPNEIFDKFGADALRWYFFANQPPWTSIRYSEQAIKDSIPEFLLRLWNVYSFFVIYAKIDGFDPAAALASSGAEANAKSIEQLTPANLAMASGYRAKPQRGELDRWILGELAAATGGVIERMDAYDNYGACGLITAYVDALSNWYVRRSRDRFWAEDKHDPDKLDAYWTLYECLLETSKLIAPFVPFLAEALWRNLAVTPFGDRVLESVHLCDYPTGQDAAASGSDALDARLSTRMALVREIVSLGRSARMGAKLKVRQPLAKVEVILADRQELAWLETHVALIAEELNVHEVEFSQDRDQYITYTVLPDLKRLGPRIGKRLPALKAALAKADAAALLAGLSAEKVVNLDLPDGPLTLDEQDLQIRLQAKPGWAAAQGHGCVVVLSTEITAELELEGIARELVHAIQNVRKDMCCEYTDRIDVGMVTTDAKVLAAVAAFGDYILRETLTRDIAFELFAGVDPIEVKIGGELVSLYVKVAKS